MTEVMVSVAPNGGRLTKRDHPHLPLSIEELAAAAKACSAEGAGLMHFHVRDPKGRPSLDPALYREALREMRDCPLILQISSEVVGGHSREQQARCILESGCVAASLAFREICPSPSPSSSPSPEDRGQAHKLYAEAAERGIHLQHILYSRADVVRFQDALEAGIVVVAHRLCVLFVWRVSPKNSSERDTPESFDHFLDSCLQGWHGGDAPLWFVCAFANEQERLLQAAARGGHVRVGFENNLLRPDASLAASNSAQVAALASCLRARAQPVASTERCREQFFSFTKK